MKSLLATALAVLLFFTAGVTSLNIAYCSSENTASSGPSTSNFQSNGLCQQQCLNSFAFAVLQGKECWCSNFIPADQTSTGSCNDGCPGFPSDKCGNSDEGLFGYIALGNVQPSGTAGGSSSAASTTQQSTQAVSTASPSPVTVFQTVTASPSVAPSSSSSSSSSSPSPTPSSTTSSSTTSTSPSPTQPVTVVSPGPIVTVTASGRIITISPSSTPSDAANLGQSVDHSGGGGGPSGGKIAGIVIGCVLGVIALVGGLVFFLWRRRRDNRRNSGDASSDDRRSAGFYNDRDAHDDMVRRHNSQMSQSGLLGGSSRPTLNTQGLSNGRNGTSPNTPSSHRLSIPMSSHPVLDPNSIGAAYINSGYRNSNVSLNDNEDYSRKVLTLTNPD